MRFRNHQRGSISQKRGMSLMPWTELSQRDFLERVVPSGMLGDEQLLETSKEIMAIVVQNPGRIDNDSRGEQ